MFISCRDWQLSAAVAIRVRSYHRVGLAIVKTAVDVAMFIATVLLNSIIALAFSKLSLFSIKFASRNKDII